MDVYGSASGASAAAAGGLVQYVLGAVFPLFTVHSECVKPQVVKAAEMSQCTAD